MNLRELGIDPIRGTDGSIRRADGPNNWGRRLRDRRRLPELAAPGPALAWIAERAV